MSYSPCGGTYRPLGIDRGNSPIIYRCKGSSCKYYKKPKESGYYPSCSHPKEWNTVRVWQGILRHHWDDKYDNSTDVCRHFKPGVNKLGKEMPEEGK